MNIPLSTLPFQIIYLTLVCVAYLANLLSIGGGYLNPPIILSFLKIET